MSIQNLNFQRIGLDIEPIQRKRVYLSKRFYAGAGADDDKLFSKMSN